MAMLRNNGPRYFQISIFVTLFRIKNNNRNKTSATTVKLIEGERQSLGHFLSGCLLSFWRRGAKIQAIATPKTCGASPQASFLVGIFFLGVNNANSKCKILWPHLASTVSKQQRELESWRKVFGDTCYFDSLCIERDFITWACLTAVRAGKSEPAMHRGGSRKRLSN